MDGTPWKTYLAETKRIQTSVGVADFNVFEDLEDCHNETMEEIDKVEAQFLQDVPLECIDEPISIDAVTTSVIGDTVSSSNCPICLYDTPALTVLTKPCGHTYHKECLESWIHACAPNSHSCPLCRTELFPQPEYQHRPSEMADNYQERLSDLVEQEDKIWRHLRSAEWLHEEMEQMEKEDGVDEEADDGNMGPDARGQDEDGWLERVSKQ
jgi:hypothetical protein